MSTGKVRLEAVCDSCKVSFAVVLQKEHDDNIDSDVWCFRCSKCGSRYIAYIDDDLTHSAEELQKKGIISHEVAGRLSRNMGLRRCEE